LGQLLPEEYRADARQEVLKFIEEGMSWLRGRPRASFILLPYPEVIDPQQRCLGYIWQVLVLPDHQRQGVGRALVEAALKHLRELGCTVVVRTLGFYDGTEMRLKL
jgi:GNAT superfamily N-acetyltransferase